MSNNEEYIFHWFLNASRRTVIDNSTGVDKRESLN